MEKCRVAIFAHYDKDNIIDDYVIFYLRELKKVCEKIIFVSACDLSLDEKSKISDFTSAIIAQNHNEYDFGSYKRGFVYLKNAFSLSNIDELIIANDSCFAPLFPLNDIFRSMQNVNCDFWGISENKFDINYNQNRHLQSYFLVFKKQIFQSQEFGEFLSSVTAKNFKNDVIQDYEVGLSNMLFDKGFIGKSFLQKYTNENNPTIFKWKEILKNHESPFLKCALLRLQANEVTTVMNWENLFVNYYDYDINLIKKNLERLKIREINKKYPLFIKEFFFKIYNSKYTSFKIKRYMIIFIKRFIPDLLD